MSGYFSPTSTRWLSALVVSISLFPLGVSAQLKTVGAPTGTAQGGLVPAIVTVINAVLLLVGIAATIMLIYGGVLYITSRGDTQSAEKAKKTILYAIVGLIVIGLSSAIVRFVVGGWSATI